MSSPYTEELEDCVMAEAIIEGETGELIDTIEFLKLLIA